MVQEIASLEQARPQTTAEPLVCILGEEDFISQIFHSAGLPVRTFASGADFLKNHHHSGSCCLVLDVSTPEVDGFEIQKELANRSEQLVFLTDHGDVPMCARAMKAGAVDFLSKPASPEILLEAVDRALARSYAILAASEARATARMKISRLTPREFAVMERVIAGLLNKQIAAELGSAEKTIKVHRGRMMRKTGVVSVADLVRLAVVAEILEFPESLQPSDPGPPRHAAGGTKVRQERPHARLAIRNEYLPD
ncbi:MAG: LuxR C-terminal-related transcriptional regulator [Luteolibacter sp.]|uniref:response regulator transcription factor n=1 Tax=Luteolibacter sp. TaxID=1962973 RepID=UPI0032676B33